jgi:curved DNA-binding protein CbpA
MSAENLTQNYYDLLQLTPSASVQQIRRSYRELSKLYHPDTTTLPPAIATAKFQQLNEAYATLSSPERRLAYDLKLGYSRVSVIQQPAGFNRPSSERKYRSSAYLDPTDRPLSAGEIFALFILGLTFAACLVLVFAVGVTRGEMVFQPLSSFKQPATSTEIVVDQPQSDRFEAPAELNDRHNEPTQNEAIAAPILNSDNDSINAAASESEAPDRANLPQQKSTLLQLIKKQPDFMLS